MYLVQEHQLKSHRISGLLLNLPPITDLGAVNRRLTLAGFLLLSVAFVAGVAAGIPITGLKTGVSFAIWALYGALFAMDYMRLLPTHRVATGSVVIFLLALITLPTVSHLSAQ
jgi:ABC-type uncharacterized transport system permease subunit